MSNLLKERNTGEALCLLYAFLKIGDKQSHFVFYFRLDYQTRDYITRVLKPYAYRSLKRIKEKSHFEYRQLFPCLVNIHYMKNEKKIL